MNLMNDMIRGQKALDTMKAEIDEFIAIVNAFLKQTLGPFDKWYVKDGFLVDNLFSVYVDDRGVIAIARNSKRIQRADQIAINDIHFIHERISRGVEGLFKKLGLEEDFAKFSKSFLRHARPRIIVKRRSDDFHASMENQVGIWGRGKSPAEAIGDMVQAHAAFFSIVVDTSEISVV